MAPSESSALKAAVYLGRRATLFLKSETWRDIETELAARQEKLTDEIRAAATRIKDPAELGLFSALRSGQSLEVERLSRLFDLWISDGLEAENKLKELGVQL